MTQYIGLDVSMKETAVSIRQDGKRIWRGKCPSDPDAIAKLVRKRAPMAARAVFETGPLAVWFYHELKALNVPAIARRQNIWRKVWRGLAECWSRRRVDVRRRACGAASADVRWSVA